MATQDPERPYTQRDVQNMLMERLPGGKHTWIRDPEGNPAVQAYGATYLPSQPVYLYYRPSVVKMMVRFTPRRISLTREAELWEAAEAVRAPLRKAGITARRQKGNTQETEREEQWVVSIPERLTEDGYETLETFVMLAASCMGVETEDE
ncbi:MAG: hypothetical protein K0Q72_835 [Armatimonadetes bacterium]|jgi:hypothetical protein|nr:hypothetical protein [Armatimonadota bacterium]